MTETKIKVALIPYIKNGGISAAFAEWLENNAAATTFTKHEIQFILKSNIKKSIFGAAIFVVFVIFFFIIGVTTGEIILIVLAFIFSTVSIFIVKHALKTKNAIKSGVESGKYAAYIVSVDEKLAYCIDSDDGISRFYIRCGEAEINKNAFDSAKEILSQYRATDSSTRRNIIDSGNDALLQMRRLSEPNYIPNGFVIEIDYGLYKRIYDRVIAVVCYGSNRKAVHFLQV